MKTSFIIPAYNEEYLIEETILSLQTACQKISKPYEIIVVNDCSTDNTEAIAKRNNVTVHTVELHNIAGVRNAGASIATGELLCFIDADTQVNSDTLIEMHQAIDNGIIGGSAKIKMDDNTPLWGNVFIWFFSQVYFRLKFAAGCFIFSTREAFDKTGGFNDQFFAGEDFFFSKKLKQLGKFIILEPPVLTSGRKMRMNGPWQTFQHLLGILRHGLGSRKGLDLWYDGQRENDNQKQKDQ